MPKSPDPIDVHVGARLRFRRMAIGMSQEALGERLGVTFQQIQKYEKGLNRIGAARLYMMGRVMNVPVAYFFEDLPESGCADDPAASPIAFLSTPEGLQLNLAFARIADADTRRKVVELVRALAVDPDAQ
ncbi:MAG: XRE family transcriptional regulator [Rhodobacteraceae bacterium]|nr:MAG: XRE family transcriptional regulator [Paracoccaceae bacterium]